MILVIQLIITIFKSKLSLQLGIQMSKLEHIQEEKSASTMTKFLNKSKGSSQPKTKNLSAVDVRVFVFLSCSILLALIKFLNFSHYCYHTF